MGREDQGVAVSRHRYQVIPRTLCFITHGEEVLLLLGGARKRLWAGRYNGLGGHVEAGEDIYTSARREVREEAGLEAHDLRLRGVVHADAGDPAAGILFFVFTATADNKACCLQTRVRWNGGLSAACRLTAWWKICRCCCRRSWPWARPTHRCSLPTATMRKTSW